MNVNGEHVVYRCYDAAGRVIYIGATSDIRKRLKVHRRDSPWFSEVFAVESTVYPERWLAFYAEGQAIRDENPRHNRMHTPRYAHPNKRAGPRPPVAARSGHHAETAPPHSSPGQGRRRQERR
jgi:predicted GIY-YIG superfamily endonuclease